MKRISFKSAAVLSLLSSLSVVATACGPDATPPVIAPPAPSTSAVPVASPTPPLATKGKYLATNGDPNGPIESRSTFYAQRFKSFLDKSPELYGKADTVLIDGKAPKLPQEGTLDAVIIMRGLHGMKNSGTLA